MARKFKTTLAKEKINKELNEIENNFLNISEVEEQTFEQQVAEEIVLEPILEETTDDHSVLEPAIEESVLEPAIEESVLEPAIEESVLEPILEETTDDHSVLEPVIEELEIAMPPAAEELFVEEIVSNVEQKNSFCSLRRKREQKIVKFKASHSKANTLAYERDKKKKLIDENATIEQWILWRRRR